MMDFQLFTETPACGWSFEFPKVVAAVVPPLLDFRALNLLQCITHIICNSLRTDNMCIRSSLSLNLHHAAWSLHCGKLDLPTKTDEQF